MKVFLTNFGLLDHAIERCILEPEVFQLIVFIPRLDANIQEDIEVKVSRISSLVEVKFHLSKNYFIDSLTTLWLLKASKTVYYDDFSGKDILALVAYFFRRKILFLHDVVPHMGEWRIFDLFKPLFYIFFMEVQVCSSNSYNSFIKRYPILKKKLVLNKLPTYQYMEYGVAPSKLFLPPKFILIFGRVSPYKGIDNFITIFDHSMPVVIVGKGHKVIHPNVTHINEFVPVSELNYYIVRSTLVVLPYLEATQSGVLSVLRGFQNVMVLVRDIPAFENEEFSANMVRYRDETLNFLVENSLNDSLL